MNNRFNPGDRVVFTNEYGVCFGVKTIIDVELSESRGWTYRVHPTDCPWFFSEEARFAPASNEDELAAALDMGAYFQKKYGFPTTDEQRAALLDNDPFEGEQ